MKIPIALLLFTPLILPAEENLLSETDRQLLLERLEKIKDTSDATVEGRHQVALKAFRQARLSDAAAHALYLDCVEKVQFDDELKKTSEFRDWKQRHKERTDNPAFRLALRHQLNWLALTIEAIHAKDASRFASTALEVTDAVLKDAEKLKDQQRILKASVLQSVFAEAYSITSETPANWPDNPVDLATLYDGLVLPPLRNDESLTGLRSSWLKRIEQEGTLVEQWSNTATSDRDRKPAFEEWRAEKQPELMWRMEVDLFRSGDQKGSSIRMLEHLKKHLNHKSAPGWISDFTSLVEGKSIAPPISPEE